MTQDDVIFDDLNPPEPVITSGRACNVRYRLSDNYAATSGDWIGLFRCSDDACELVGFEWAATDDPKDTGHRRRRLYFHADQIKRPLRAKDDDFYHFAYVTRVGRIAGQSNHFRIRQGEDPTSRSPALTSLGPADVCYAARQCLTNCRMLPITDGRNSQALEKFKGVIEQMEMRKANECSCHSAWQKGCDYQTPGKILGSQGRLRTSSLKSDLKSGCLRLETSSQNGCHGCQMALRELRSLKNRLETELTAGRTTLEEMEQDMEVQREARAAQEQTGTNSKETGPVKEEELLDVIEDLKLALDWSKERERCLQHQLNLERTMRMELVRSREDLEGSRPVSGMRTSLSKQQDSHRFQVDISGTPSYNVATKDKKCGSNDSLESPMSRCVTEKDVRGKMVLVCADCLQRKEQQKEQNQQKQLKQNPSISIDRPRRPKKSDETDTESRKASAKRLVSGTDRYTYLSDGQRASEVRLRQDVDLGEQQLVPVAFRDTEMVSNSQVCDTVSAQKLTEVLREESAQKVPDLQTVRDCLGEILALQAAVETSLSEINNKEAVVPDVSRKPEVKGTGQAVSSAVGMSLDVEKKSTYPEAVVVSTKEGKQPSIVSTLSPDRKAVDQKSFKPYGLGSPVIQITTDDQLSRASRKSDRQQGPGNTTVIVRSGDSLTTYSGSNLSLWLMLGNDSEPDRIIAKQNKKASHKSQRPPRGYELLTETKYRGSSSSNAPVDTERTSSGTNEMTKKRNEEDEAAAACLDRTPSSNANYDGLKGISCYAPISSADVKTTQTEGTFRPSGPSALSTMNTPYQSPAVQQRLTHPLNTPSISRQQLVAAAAALLSSNENLLDSSSSPNQTSISRQQLAAASAALLSSDETTADYSSTPNQTSISRQQLAAATAALLSLNETSADSSSTPNQTSISRQQLAAATAALLSLNETSADSSSTPNQTSISRQQLAAATAALLSLNETSAYSSSTPNQTSVSRQQLVAAAAELLSSNETSTDFSSSLNKTSISRQQLAAALLSPIETSTDSKSPPNAPHQSPAVQQRSTHPVNTPSISRQQLAAAAAALLSSNETSTDFSSSLNQTSISRQQLAAALLSSIETSTDSNSPPNAPHQSPAVQQRSTHPVNTPSISRQQLAAAAAALLSSNETSADYSSTLNQTSISSKQLTAAAAALLSLNETAADSSSTPNQTSISWQQLAAAAAVLLSPNETSADSSSTSNQSETKKASRSTDNSYYRIMTSPNDFDIDDSLPITLTGPPSVIKTISSALSGIAKEYSASDFKRSSRFEVVVPSACDPQQLAKPDAASSDRTTQAEANLSTDASCSADGTNCNRCTKSAVKVTSTEGGIKFHLHSGILRSSPSSGTNDDIELIRRLSEMGARNAVLLESEERKESPKPEDPVFTSSSRFCFISDETIRCLSGILESAMHLTAALKVLDASCPEQTVQPSEVTVTDTAKSTVYNEESSPSTSTVAGRNLRQVKIIKPMPLGRSTGGARTPDSATSGTKPCKGMNSRQSGAAFQNARIISDGIREYHRRMKANVEVTEETQKALKVVEEYYFPDPPPKGNTEGNVTTESDAINSVREQHAVESVSQTGAAASVPSSDHSSPSPQDAAPKVRASTTMTTESAAVTCCPKTFLRQQDSLDLRRCDCQAHRNALPDEMHQDGSADEEVLPSEDATVEGPQQCLYSTDECAHTAPSGALSSKLRPSETDAAAGADGISSAVDGVSVKSTGNDLELPIKLSMATTELEEITPVTSG